jgi:excinuclease UvrABC nuclease subunit
MKGEKMATNEFKLIYDGYWRDQNKNGIPSHSGIYCVYTCTYNSTTNSISLDKLIYIGESEDVKSRIINHEKYSKWKQYLTSGQELCYSTAPISSTYRVRCEAALINKHKPPVNDEYKNSFPFDTTTIYLSGEIAKLVQRFTIYRH